MTRNSFITDERISSEGFFATFVRRVKEGQLGSFPVILALIVIVIVFQSANSKFISPANLVNLSTQVAFLAILALGINLILLLGEIDLSLAQLGGLSASLLGVLVVRQGVPPLIALVIMLVLGLVVGAIQGWFFAVVGIPAFVVTLAGLLAFTGLTLTTLGVQKNLSMADTFAFDFASFYFPAIWAYVFGAVAVIGFGAGIIYSKLRRHNEGLDSPSWTSVIVRIAILTVVVFGFLILVNQDFGLAMPFFLMIVIAIVIDLVLRKTKYGRSIYAVGGKVEAARRAGIRVTWVRISVFMAAGVLAALFGFIKTGVTTNAGSTLVSTQDLLNAIAAAVIGGTSLFGGRGTAWAAVLGALVVGAINNGLYLIGFNSDAQQIITALVLLTAVVIDALSRRGQRYVGRG
ncbi:MAG: sugar ABC transporter permease [Brevibacterium aurantiacum]|uniref:Xylose transport system permease protein XylH n=2 Tax=Brevibacterium TaxID=1696 RepID=A0A1D7W6W0_BREAU|nr:MULTISPECIES: monosaccharide-transporting ATPase [Brevibacterium]MDN5550977.1 ABC transporter permease [Brevibacterium sp.]AOP54710.1 putative ABC transporter permease protein [Brevibacterium aurantiacum]AZL06624.1 ABC transporter permease [Brevibacterium aurantiacum]AZL13912.1 ABC transporter permease [Brevibacterium aurantiacum]AZT94431.1 ABC transporter permease [Brevibacterium aurantiacum]